MIITDHFRWFFGVVENNDDPVKMGRVQVRCFNIHTSDKELLPTEDLPWAQVIMPSNSASVGDVGWSPTGILAGAWVMGFFADGDDKQRPFVIGTIPGHPLDAPDPTVGFNDPAGFYPSRLGESDVNRLSKNDGTEHASIPYRNALVDSLIGEPVPNRDSVYPKNHVWETESGHFIELDDTPGANRMTHFHNSGTMEEIHPNGDRVARVIGDNYEIKFGDDSIHVRGDVKVYVDGSSLVYVRENAEIQVDGNLETYVGGDYNMNVQGAYTVRSQGSIVHTTDAEYNVNSQGKNVTKASEVDINSGDGDITFYSADDIRGFYCDDVDFRKNCIFLEPTDAEVVVKDAYPNVEAPPVNYGAEIPVYTNAGGAAHNPGDALAPERDGGPSAGSVAPPAKIPEFKHDGTLGALSARYESNGNPCAIGRDRVGGWSYGKYQIASRVGTFRSFMDYLSKNYPEYHTTLQNAGGTSAAKAGTSGFRSAWQSICGKEGFGKAQHDFIQATHYEHSKRLIARLGINLDERSAALRDVVWSTSVQHGPNTSVFKIAIANAGGPTASDEALINAIYDERGKTSGGTLVRFRRSTPGVQASVKRRFASERAGALQMLRQAA